jgi:hypothetical protein
MLGGPCRQNFMPASSVCATMHTSCFLLWCVGLARLIRTAARNPASMCACLTPSPVLWCLSFFLLRLCLTRFDFEGVDVPALFSEFQETEKRLKELKEKGGIQRQVGVCCGCGSCVVLCCFCCVCCRGDSPAARLWLPAASHALSHCDWHMLCMRARQCRLAAACCRLS